VPGFWLGLWKKERGSLCTHVLMQEGMEISKGETGPWGGKVAKGGIKKGPAG